MANAKASMAGWIGFAGIVMLILGGIDFFQGLIALFVFSPVWAEWRQSEKDRKEQPATRGAPLVQATVPGNGNASRAPGHQDG